MSNEFKHKVLLNKINWQIDNVLIFIALDNSVRNVNELH